MMSMFLPLGHLLKLSMDDLMVFFQGKLEKDFGFDEDEIIDSLIACMAELRRARLDLPPPAADTSELPNQPFGLFAPASVQQVIGRRTLETETELIHGRRATFRRESRLSISIPPDGGPEKVENGVPVSRITLPRVDSVDESDSTAQISVGYNAADSSNSGSRRPPPPNVSKDQRDWSSRDAMSIEAKRAAFAKAKSSQTSSSPRDDIAVQVRSNGGPSGMKSTASPSLASKMANGAAGPRLQPSTAGSVAADGKGKPSFRRVRNQGKDRTGTSDLVAPQQYGVTVRL